MKCIEYLKLKYFSQVIIHVDSKVYFLNENFITFYIYFFWSQEIFIFKF